MITMVLYILLKSSLLQMARKVVAMLQLLILQRRLRQSSRLQNQEEHSLATRVTGTFVVSLFTLLLFDGSVTIYIALAGLSTQKLVCSLIRRQNTVMGNEVHGKVTQKFQSYVQSNVKQACSVLSVFWLTSLELIDSNFSKVLFAI